MPMSVITKVDMLFPIYSFAVVGLYQLIMCRGPEMGGEGGNNLLVVFTHNRMMFFYSLGFVE